MPCTFQLEIDELSPQAQDIYHHTLRDFQDYGPPPDDHHCFGARDHHDRYNYEDADRFQAYTKALDLRFEEPGSQGATRGTVRTAPEVDTVQGHYGIYRIIDQVHNARIAQACHPGLRDMEFIEIDISDELYFGDILAVKTLAFNPGYFPRPRGSSVLPYHRTTATLPGDHCKWSAKEYLVFRRDIRRSQALLRVDDRVGVIEGFSGLTRLPSSFHVGRVYLGDVFYPEHLEIRGLTPILTHLPTILRHWKSRCAVPESLRSLADSADLQTARFDHRMFQHRVKICRDDELTVNCSADWLEGSRVLVSFLDREIEAVLVKSCNGYLTFQLLERYTGPSWVPVMVQQLGFQGAPFGNRGRSRRSSEAGFEADREDRGDRGDRGYRGRSRSPSEERYQQPLVGVYDPEPNRGSPVFEERYGRDEGRGSPRDQWDGPPGQRPRDSRQGYRPGSPDPNWDRQGQWDSPARQDSRDSRQGYRPGSPGRSPDPRQSSQWDRNGPPSTWNDSPRDFQPGEHFRQSEKSWDAQFRRPESEQYQNDRQHPSEYRNQHQQCSEPQFNPQGDQFYRSQPEDRPNDSRYPSSQSGHLQDRSLYHNPLEGRYNDSPCSSDQRSLTLDQYNAQNYQNYQREKRQSYGNGPQYPSDCRGQPQDHIEPQFSTQNAQYYRNQSQDRPENASRYPSDQSGRPHYQHGSQNDQFFRSQSGDRPKASQYPSSPQHSYDYPIIQTEQPHPQQSPQADQGYRNQAHGRLGNASRYPSDQPGAPHPQFSPQGAQSYPSNQSGHPLETPILTQNSPPYRNQPGDRQVYANDSQYPSEHPCQPQNHFKPQFSPQNDRHQSHGRPQYPPGPSNPQYSPQYHRNQSEDRQTLPRSLSPRVSTLSPSGDPIIRHSQSRSSVSQASSISGDHFQGEQPRFDAPSAPRAAGESQPRPSQGYNDHPVRNPQSYHGNRPQGPQPPANQGHDVPSTSRAAGYSDGLSPTGQSYYQGYATSSDGSEEDDSSSESEPEALPQVVQKQGYNALYSHFPSSSGQKPIDRYSPRVPSQIEDHQGEPQGAPSSSAPREPGQTASTFTSEPVEPTEPPKPARAVTPPFDPHNSRSWRHEHKDDICEVLEPVSQGQGGSRASQRPSQPVRDCPEPSKPSNRSSGDQRPREPVRDHLDPEPRQSKSDSRSSVDYLGSQTSDHPRQPVRDYPEPSGPGNRSSTDRRDPRAIHEPSQPSRDHWDPEPSQSKSGSRYSSDHRTSQGSQRPSHPVNDCWDPQTSTRSSTDSKGSQASHHPVQDSWPVNDHQDSKPSRSSLDRKASTASHYSTDPKWPSEPENSAPEEDQHPETPAQDHPYLPALLKHQVLVVDALDAELHIASAAASVAKTDWSLKTRGLKQRGTQVIVCKAPDASRITGMLLDALEGSGASGLRLIRFTGEHLLKIDFDRCLARKLRGILREPGAWDQRIVLQAARYLTQDPLTPKLENLLRNNSHIPEMPLEEWVAWYMERWVPDVLLSTAEYLEVGTKYLRRVESVQVLGEVSQEHGGLTARFPKAKIAVIGDVLGSSTVPRHPETVEILKESFSGLQGSQLISLRAEAPFLRPPGPDYLKIRPGIFPNPNFPILLIHNTSTKGTKEQRNLQERKALDELVKGLLGLENEFSIPPEDLQIICIEKNQVRDLRAISTPGIRIRSRQEASEGVQGVLTQLEGSPSPRAPEEDDSAPQDHHQTTPIAIICCSNYKKTAFELIRAQLPQLLSYGTQATIFIGNVDEMEESEGWGALVTRCEEVGCSYSYQMVPEERSWKYQPTKRDHKGFMGPLPAYGSSRGSSSEFGGFESPKSRSSGSGSPRSVTRGSELMETEPRATELDFEKSKLTESEPEFSQAEAKESELSKSELEACEPKSEEPEPLETKPEESEPSEPKSEKTEASVPKLEVPELSEPSQEEPESSKLELEACESKPEKPESLEPEHEACEPKFEESESSGPKSKKSELSEHKLEACEPKSEQSEPSKPKPDESEPKPEDSEPYEPKPEKPEPSETKPATFEPSEPKSEPSETGPEACEPKSEESGAPDPLETNPEEPELSEPKPEESGPSEPGIVTSEPSKPKFEPSKPKSEESELPEPSRPELKARESKSEESEPSGPDPEACDIKPEESEPAEPELELPEPSGSEPKVHELKSEESEPTKPEPEACEPKFGENEPFEPKPEVPGPSETGPVPSELSEPKPELSALEPEASEPKPEKPEPSEPKTEKTEVTEPKPEEPELTEPMPEEPEPLETKPEEPEQSEPQPEEPEPTEPEPELTEPKPKEIELPEPKPEDSEPLDSALKVLESKFEESEPSEPESEPSEPRHEQPEPLEPEHKACEPKFEESEQLEPESVPFKPSGPESEPSKPEFEVHEHKPEEPELTEPKPEPSGPQPEAHEPKSEEPEPELKGAEPSGLHPTATESNPLNSALEHLDLAITATVSPTLSPAIPRKSCSQTPKKDFTTPDCLLENLTLEDLEPSDQEYEDCEEEFQDAQEAENQDSDTGTYESTYYDHQETTGPEESESLEKLEEKQ